MPKSILSGIILVAVVGALFFVGWPKYQELADLKVQLKAKQKELQNKESYIASLHQAKEELGKYQEELAKVQASVPESPDMPSLMEFIQKASSQSGLVLKNLGSFSTGSVLERPNLKETYLDFEVSGLYPSFRNFLSAMEKSSRIIEVDTAKVSPETERKDEEEATVEELASLLYSFKIKVYSY